MNLNQALNVALPEIPARTLAQRYPRLDPDVTFKEHLQDGELVVRIYAPSTGLMYTLPEKNWNLIRLFDGKRSYEDIATLYSAQNGVQYDAAQVREFAGDLEASDFWYKTTQERNILLMQQSAEEPLRRYLHDSVSCVQPGQIYYPPLWLDHLDLYTVVHDFDPPGLRICRRADD